MHHRSWFPFILVGLSLLLLLVLVVGLQPSEEKIVFVSETSLVPISEIDYESDVIAILEQLQESEDSEIVRDLLLLQRVPSQYKEIHFELILVMGLYRSGEVVTAETRMNELKIQYAWLP